MSCEHCDDHGPSWHHNLLGFDLSWFERVVLNPEFVSGWAAGSLGILCTQPIDVVRIRMQVPTVHQKSTIVAQTQQILHGDGFRGLFRGVFSPTVSVGLMSAVLFHTYETGRRHLQKWRYLQYETRKRKHIDRKRERLRLHHAEERLKRQQSGESGNEDEMDISYDYDFDESELLRDFAPFENETYADMWLAGALAGTVSTVITCPTELVKCVVQLEEGAESATIREELNIARRLGIFRCYRGLAVTVARDSMAFAVYFPLYYWWVQKFTRVLVIASVADDYYDDFAAVAKAQTQSSANDGAVKREEQRRRRKRLRKIISANTAQNIQFQSDYIVPFTGGGLAGLVSWFIVYPFDVMKTQYQTHSGLYKYSLLVGAKHQLKYRGVLSFYRGCNATMLRAGVQHGLVFICYEWIKRAMEPEVIDDDMLY